MNGKSAYEAAQIAVDYTVHAMELTIDDALVHTYGVYFEKALPLLMNKLSLIK